MTGHRNYFGNNSSPRPLYTEDLDQLLQVDGGSLSNGEYNIPKPRHAEVAELLVKELFAKLGSEQGNIFDDRLPDTPLLVRCKLNNCRKKGLREEFNADYCSPLGFAIASERQQTYHCSQAQVC
jgi:hypothetical protein